jgi:uncharacterized membrane protein YagU involved in acid resistance
MRLEKQNRRSCLGLLAFLAVLAGIIVWMSLGGVKSDTPANDPQGPVDAIPPPRGKAPPPGTAVPAPAPVR